MLCTTRTALRRSFPSAASRATLYSAPRQSSRTLFTSAPKKSTFKSTALRWVAAAGVIYYYATSSVFAEEKKFVEKHPPPLTPEDERPKSRIDDVLKAAKEPTQQVAAPGGPKEESRPAPPTPSAEEKPAPPVPSAEEKSAVVDHSLKPEGGPEGLVEEAGQEGAFNPETGEINWDCPCLGGMAHGPCGEQFKDAFSCFVYSTAEPKGIECIDKFKAMQACFQEHPEIYGSELEDEEEEDKIPAGEDKIPAKEEDKIPAKEEDKIPAKEEDKTPAKEEGDITAEETKPPNP
ncbi:intermembrane space import and assembly protein 40 [Sphaerosporella brunnea]|uniref:Mitochondrial intermembrane space import and assembly protein 40 n=1 Tax=Sphaerosporella brunnea TaxID=1250544 RepID=A0A5J5EXQ1_9PEZI|nr:intermembrane space import and assembly protein 40 [Sphaerosporella brunnea]